MNEQNNNNLQSENEINEELAKLDNPKSKKNKKKLVSSIIFFLMVIIVFLSILFSLGDITSMLETFSNIAKGSNYMWLIFAVISAVAFFILYPVPLLILSKSFDKNTSTSDALLIGAGEHFFNGVTPFAAGGQPIQIYDFTKKGMKSSTATGLVLSNFIIYLFVLNLYEVLALIFYPSFSNAIMNYSISINPGNPDATYWTFVALAIMGYVFNLGFFAFVCCLGLNKGLANLLIKGAKWLCKAKWINKFLGPKIPDFEKYCMNVQSTTKALLAHKKAVFFATLVKLVVYGIYFFTTFFIIKSVMVGSTIGFDKFIETGFATAFASAAVCWVPTPGGTGGIEMAFAIVARAVTGEASIDYVAVSLIWRLLTFYLILLLSLGAVIIFEIGYSKKLNNDEKKENALLKKLLAKKKEKNQDKINEEVPSNEEE